MEKMQSVLLPSEGIILLSGTIVETYKALVRKK